MIVALPGLFSYPFLGDPVKLAIPRRYFHCRFFFFFFLFNLQQCFTYKCVSFNSYVSLRYIS